MLDSLINTPWWVWYTAFAVGFAISSTYVIIWKPLTVSRFINEVNDLNIEDINKFSFTMALLTVHFLMALLLAPILGLLYLTRSKELQQSLVEELLNSDE